MAILFCVITMLGWGSWANTQKLAGKEKWPFELFYWDYAIGVFLFSLLFAATFGSFGTAGTPALENLRQADMNFVWPALIFGRALQSLEHSSGRGYRRGGDERGVSGGVGLALVIGTLESYIETPKGDPACCSQAWR